MRKTRFGRLVVLAMAAAITLAAREPGEPLRPGFNLFSKQQDVDLGREAAAELRKQATVVDNRLLQDYIQRVGKRLTSKPEVGDYPFTFTVLLDKNINAFALPGGPTFVNSGTIAVVDNEAQLAGVIAHELSHVALRHGTSQASKANLLQIPAVLVGAIIGNGSLLGQLAQLGIGFGLNSVLLKYSRDNESQADALGAHIMSEAGYNPIELSHFFEKLEGQAGSRAPQFLSDHPNPGNREKAIAAEIRTLPHRTYGYETGEFARAKAEVAKLPASSGHGFRSGGEAPKPEDVRPSGNFKKFQGRSFSFSYPDNWQVFGDQNADAVTIAPRAGLVQGSEGNTQIGYGVIAGYSAPENQGESLGQSTEDLIHHLRAANANMRTTDASRKLKVGGSQALITTLTSSSPFNGAEETDSLLTVARPDGVFYMVFIAPAAEFRKLDAVYEDMVASVRFQ